MILVGNKVDLEESRVVTKAEGEALAREMGEGVNFEETSAKADINVTKVFIKVYLLLCHIQHMRGMGKMIRTRA